MKFRNNAAAESSSWSGAQGAGVSYHMRGGTHGAAGHVNGSKNGKAGMAMGERRRLAWPHELRHTGTRDRWFAKFSKLKPGLSLHDVAKMLGESYASVYRWADLFGYSFPDLRRRGRVSESAWADADWSLRDADLARQLGVSRERIRQVRAARGIGPSAHRNEVQKFQRWVKANVQKLHGQPVAEVMESFGGSLSLQVARRILRSAGVKPHDPGSRWRGVDWRLPNRDLAKLWDASPKYVANIRARLKVGPARFNLKNGNTVQNDRYKKAVADERKKVVAARKMQSAGKK